MKARWPALSLAAALACGRGGPPPNDSSGPPAEEPPVALNPEPPIQYPPALYDQRVEGSVVLRLFVDSTGRLSPESTKVAESSGYPALDSAAVAGAGRLHFAPGRRRGIPVATAFLQPVEFRHPTTPPATATAAPSPAPAPALRPRVAATPASPASTIPAAPARPRPDSTRPRADTTRVRPDSARTDTTQKSDTNAVTH